MIAPMLAGVATGPCRIWRRRLITVSCIVAFGVGVTATADASCAVPNAPRTARLATIAAGRSGFDVAFVGRLIRRLPTVKRNDRVFNPLDFAVTKAFTGRVGTRVRVLVEGGCVGKACESVEDTVTYTSRSAQLVLADRTPTGLVSASACTDAGPLSTADLSLLLQDAQLPFTGRNASLPISAAFVLLITGVALLRAARRRAHN